MDARARMLTVAVAFGLAACGTPAADETPPAAATATQVAATGVSATSASVPVVSVTEALVATLAPSTPAPTPPTPTCNTFYRATETVPPDYGPVLTFPTSGESVATFDDLQLSAIYSDGQDDVPSLIVQVEALPEGTRLFSSLYQFADLTADYDAFGATGQGFTGLIYVYNPVTGAELQFFCSSQ
jgi:hypothetical protein